MKDGANGVLFDKQTVKSLCEGILRFEEMEFDADKVAKSAEKFAEKRFERKMREVINEKTK